MRRPAGIAAALGAVMVISGCAADRPRAAEGIVVFAASSLRSVFADLAGQFRDSGVTVRFSFAGSSDLLAQLTQGAPADVFAPADEVTMTRAVDAGLPAQTPVVFAANTLTIVTGPGNPRGIAALADLTRPGTSVVICAPQVPCGAATKKVEQAAGVTIRPVSEESAVADVLGKVVSGQADAGLVYVTDARAAGDAVTAVGFAESSAAVNTYPIAVLKTSANPAAAEAFVDFVTGTQGRRALASAGFTVP